MGSEVAAQVETVSPASSQRWNLEEGQHAASLADSDNRERVMSTTLLYFEVGAVG
jgi:hypothetical protein